MSIGYVTICSAIGGFVCSWFVIPLFNKSMTRKEKFLVGLGGSITGVVLHLVL